DLISQEASGSKVDLEETQEVDTQPSKNTSEHHVEVEHGNVESSSDVVFIHRSARIPQALDRYGFYVDAEEPMNAKMQSLKYNQIWCLVDLPPDGKTVGSKWVDYEETFSPVVVIKRLLDDLRVTAAKLMLLVYKLLLLVLKVNAASTKVTSAQ
ncbi:hypothetical protein Tco_0699340, partial [Tanacetum coccineum]